MTFAKHSDCSIKCAGYVADFCCGEFCERLAKEPINNGGDAARTRAPEHAHPEGGQNKSGQSVADSVTAPPPNSVKQRWDGKP